MAVDTFFLLSGLLVMYGLTKEYKRIKRINWSLYYIHRLIRWVKVREGEREKFEFDAKFVPSFMLGIHNCDKASAIICDDGILPKFV